MEERRIKDVNELIAKAVTLRAAGHQTFCHDDPRLRALGFLDETEDVWYWTSLTDIKTSMVINSEIERKQMSTVEGRAQLFGPAKPYEPEA